MQQSPNRNFDQQVKATLENASVEPPAFLWNNIESRLPSNEAWYRKYKYLLLLLLLGTVSSSSIILYKVGNQNAQSNEIAVSKRLYKDEVNKNNVSTSDKNVVEENVSIAQKTNTNNLSELNTSSNNSNKPSVSSFYNEAEKNSDKNAINTANAIKEETAKKELRLNRFAVKENNTNNSNTPSINKNKVTQTPSENVLANNAKQSSTTSKATNNVATKSATKQNNIVAENKENITSTFESTANENTSFDEPIVANNYTNNTNNPANKIDKSTTTDLNTINTIESKANIESEAIAINQTIDITNDFDITTPIVEPIQPAKNLVASAVPIKIEQSPIKSRDLLRSTIEPEKLEMLEMETMAIGINDLNPNKEKLLKNLKQFSGYDINKGFHFGAFININNVWLNKKSFSADENTQSIKPKVTFGKSYGINIGYDYTDRWGIQLEWQISEQGQKYNVVQNNVKQNKEINLLYTKFPLMMKYKQVFINNYNSKPIALSFLFGPQFSMLIKQKGNIDGVGIQNLPTYNKAEFGILGGIDFDLFMTRNVAMTIGARSGFMSALKKGQPMSFQLGVTTQFNFRFPKKIK